MYTKDNTPSKTNRPLKYVVGLFVALGLACLIQTLTSTKTVESAELTDLSLSFKTRISDNIKYKAQVQALVTAVTGAMGDLNDIKKDLNLGSKNALDHGDTKREANEWIKVLHENKRTLGIARNEIRDAVAKLVPFLESAKATHNKMMIEKYEKVITLGKFNSFLY